MNRTKKLGSPEPSGFLTKAQGLLRGKAYLMARAAILAASFACLGPVALYAQTNTWLGTAGTTGNWSDSTKWSLNTVPDGSTAILIPTGTVRDNVSFTNAQPITIDATGDLVILSTTTITNSGTPGGGLFNNLGQVDNSGTLSKQAQVNNDGSGILNNSGSITTFFFGNDTGSTLNNSGDLVVAGKSLINEGTVNNSGTMLLSAVINDATFRNSGTVTLDSGSVQFPSQSENSAMFTNQAAGIINITGTFTNDAGATLKNMGTIANTGDLVNIGTFNNSGTVTAGGGYANTLGGTFNNTGAIITSESFENFASALNNLAGGQFTNNGSMDNAKGGTVSNAGTFTNNGLLDNGFGSFTNSGVLNNTGTITNETTFTIAKGGVVNNSGTIQNALNEGLAGSFTVMKGGTFNNSNLFISDSNSGFTMAAGSNVVNTRTGTMELSSPTLQVVVGGNLRNDGSIILMAPPPMGDPPIFLPPPTLVVASTGTMSGTGFVNGSVTVQGTMRPGDALGTLTVNGLYQQMAGSTLEILLGGANAGQFGQLVVNGDAVLGGTLDVELFGGFDPTSGEIFEILSGKISGNFADVVLPTLGDGLFFSLDQEANGVFLDVLGTQTGGGGGGTNVPEPSSVLLLAAGLCAVLGLCGRRGLCRQ